MLDKQAILDKINQHVGKHWKTASLALLLALGGGVAVSQQNNAHASTVTPNASQTRNISGNNIKRLTVPKVSLQNRNNVNQNNNQNNIQNKPVVHSSVAKNNTKAPNLIKVNNDQQQINKLNQQKQQKQDAPQINQNQEQNKDTHINNGTANANWLNHLGVGANNNTNNNPNAKGFNGYGEKPASGEDIINNQPTNPAKPKNSVTPKSVTPKSSAQPKSVTPSSSANHKSAQSNSVTPKSKTPNSLNNRNTHNNSMKPKSASIPSSSANHKSVTPNSSSINNNQEANKLENIYNLFISLASASNNKSHSGISNNINISNNVNGNGYNNEIQSLEAQEASANAKTDSLVQDIKNQASAAPSSLNNQGSASSSSNNTYSNSIDIASLDRATDARLNQNAQPNSTIASKVNSIAGTDHLDGTSDNDNQNRITFTNETTSDTNDQPSVNQNPNLNITPNDQPSTYQNPNLIITPNNQHKSKRHHNSNKGADTKE